MYIVSNIKRYSLKNKCNIIFIEGNVARNISKRQNDKMRPKVKLEVRGRYI